MDIATFEELCSIIETEIVKKTTTFKVVACIAH